MYRGVDTPYTKTVTDRTKKGGAGVNYPDKDTDTMVAASCKPEAEEIIAFINELDKNGKERLLEFIRGAKFALNLVSQKAG